MLQKTLSHLFLWAGLGIQGKDRLQISGLEEKRAQLGFSNGWPKCVIPGEQVCQ